MCSVFPGGRFEYGDFKVQVWHCTEERIFVVVLDESKEVIIIIKKEICSEISIQPLQST